jgi:hypothetical protein
MIKFRLNKQLKFSRLRTTDICTLIYGLYYVSLPYAHGTLLSCIYDLCSNRILLVNIQSKCYYLAAVCTKHSNMQPRSNFVIEIV